MKSILRRILYLSLALVAVFFVFYTAFERSTITRTEKEIVEIYELQLESILFSVNQYAQDEVESWVAKINSSAATKQGFPPTFLEDHPAIQSIFFLDSTLAVQSVQGTSGLVTETIDSLVTASKPMLGQLFTYLEADYQKLEPFTDSAGNFYLLFALPGEEKRMCGFQMSPNTFIEEVLAPRLQAVAKEDMILSAFSDEQTLVYSTDSTRLNFASVIGIPQNSLWLFPTYYLGISFHGESLNDLIDERVRNNLVLIGMLALVMVIGGYFIIQAINKEVRLSKMKSDFVSNVSHEIRTPLALISMFAETLEMGRVKDEQERNKFYHIISSETRRLAGLVNRILNFSKMEAGKRTYQMVSVNMDEVVEEVRMSYDYHLSEKGFHCTVKPCGNCVVQADRESVYEAIVNLLDNAIKYSGEAREIVIETKQSDGWVVLSVQDYGVGIEEHHQKRIFDKFYRAEDPLIHDTKGSGLGLNIVNEIMEAHHGLVKMKSKSKQGSTFELHFPLDNEE